MKNIVTNYSLVNMCTIDCILFVIGLNVIISALFELNNFISSLRAHKNLSDYGKGSWALVTACTDGIGHGFASTLAKQGFNIVQVGRNPEKLATNASDLKSKYGVQVRNVVKDFGQGPKNPIEFYEDLFAQTRDLDISILINNVGASAGRVKFLDIPINILLNELALNLFPISFLSRLYLPKLSSRAQGAAVVNLSSVMAYIIMPNFVSYCAGKAFDHALSAVASSEVGKTQHGAKVDIMSLHPGIVDTPLASKLKDKILEIQKEECAEAALKCLGSTTYTSGHPKHLVMAQFIKTLSFLAPFLK